MSFKIPIPQKYEEAYWHRVLVDRRNQTVAVNYAVFEDADHLKSTRPPLRSIPAITISGDTAVPLLATEANRLYDDTKALIGRLLTNTATAQELADVDGWQALQGLIAVPGVEHLDADPFDLSGVSGE